MDRIDELAAKLHELAACDTELQIFGSLEFGGHCYQLNPPIEQCELEALTREFGVELPHDYREFLLRIGNGGAGPFYGPYSLDKAISDRPDHRSRAFLSATFPLTEAYNPYTDAATDDEAFDDKFICGSIVLSHEGCGYYDRLVTTGPQRGQVWCDARVSDQGIVPLHCDYYEWYRDWLIDSLGSLGH